nr:hypothetical protein CFP56_43866 [Quercus suber]
MSSKRNHREISDQNDFASSAMSNKRPRANTPSKVAAHPFDSRESSSPSLSHGTAANGSNIAPYRSLHHSPGQQPILEHLDNINEEPRGVDPGHRAGPSKEAFETTQKQLAKAHEEIRRLREEIVGRDKMMLHKEAQAKQDLLLQKLLCNDQLDKARLQVERERNHTMRVEEAHTTLLDDMEDQLKRTHEDLLRTSNEMNMHKEDAEHYRSLNNLIEEDLAELRRVEAEDRQQRIIKSQGLPPAYGSLDDEDATPPHGQHHDSGAIELCTLKHVVRGQFRRAIAEAQAAALTPDRLVLDRCKQDTMHLLGLTNALQSISLSIKNAANYAKEIHLSTVKNMTLAPSAKDLYRERVRSTHQQTAVASRCANLLIESTQRYISTLEVRPLFIRLESQQKALLLVAFTSVDNALLEILYCTFTDHDRLSEMQYYFTVVTGLQEQLRGNLRTAIHLRSGRERGPFFDTSATWLGEQVEKERQLAAEKPTVVNADRVSIEYGTASEVLSSNPAASSAALTSLDGADDEQEQSSSSGSQSTDALSFFDFEGTFSPNISPAVVSVSSVWVLRFVFGHLAAANSFLKLHQLSIP